MDSIPTLTDPFMHTVFRTLFDGILTIMCVSFAIRFVLWSIRSLQEIYKTTFPKRVVAPTEDPNAAPQIIK